MNEGKTTVFLNSRASSFRMCMCIVVFLDFGACGVDSTTLISTIQGSGSEVTTTDYVIVEALVTALHVDGFFIQEEAADSDGDDATSEAIFVYTGNGGLDVAIDVGDRVRVAGCPTEYYGLSEITLGKAENCGSAMSDYNALAYVAIDLPVGDIERYEGMLASVEGVIVSLQTFTQYGEIALSDSLRWAPSDVAVPLSPEYDAEVTKNQAAVFNIDDNTTISYPDDISYMPDLSYENAPRVGYTVRARGPIHYSFSTWELIPTADTFEMIGERPREDIVRSDVTVASYNVLNYFNGRINPSTGDFEMDFSGNRGARDDEQFELQKARILETLAQLDADVITLSEVENDGFGADSAVKNLTDELNMFLGGNSAIYDYISPADVDANGENQDVTGTDAITNAIIYKIAVVEPMGEYVFNFVLCRIESLVKASS